MNDALVPDPATKSPSHQILLPQTNNPITHKSSDSDKNTIKLGLLIKLMDGMFSYISKST